MWSKSENNVTLPKDVLARAQAAADDEGTVDELIAEALTRYFAQRTLNRLKREAELGSRGSSDEAIGAPVDARK